MIRVWRCWPILAALVAPSSLQGQQDSLLLEAIRLVSEGQGDSARALVQLRLDAVGPGDSLYPEALYAAGMVSSQADTAIRYFRRVSIEYPLSDWADRALLRLAQFAFASGDYGETNRLTQRILLDYPDSEILNDAVFWSARARLATDDVPDACRLFRRVQQADSVEVELLNRAKFYLQRCAVEAAADSTTEAPAPTEQAEEPSGFTVQVAAVSSVVAADEVMRRLQANGYESRVVRDDDGLLKIRVGRFNTRTAADRLAREISNRLGQDTFVVEER